MDDEAAFTERREFERFPLLLDVVAVFPDGRYDSILLDISAGGAKFRFAAAPMTHPEPDGPASIIVPPFGEFFGNVRWIDGDYVGMQFDENHKATSSLVRAMVNDSREGLFPPPSL